jgi:hypothetical protein
MMFYRGLSARYYARHAQVQHFHPMLLWLVMHDISFAVYFTWFCAEMQALFL